MNRPFVILITGLPGAGKTTLGRRLAAVFGLPFIHKDGIKETLYDAIGEHDYQTSRRLGYASMKLLYHIAESLLAAGQSLVVEATFDPELATEEWRQAQTRYDFDALQIQCCCRHDARIARFLARRETGERHPSHPDRLYYQNNPAARQVERLANLAIGGEIIEVDTTNPATVDYAALYSRVGAALGKLIPQEALHSLSIVQELLDDTVVGVYLFGSAVMGGLRVDSDVDVLAIINQPLSEARRKEVAARLMAVSGRMEDADGTRPIELTIIHLAEIVPWRYPPRSELLYGEWLRQDFAENRVPKPEPNPDLAIVLTKVRQNSIPLLGPEARRLLEPVPTGHLRLALAETLPALMGELRGDERNVLLTLARMWLTAATGEIAPKDVAVRWATTHLPEACGAILDLARRAYLGEVVDRWDDKEREVRILARHIKQGIETCLGNLIGGKPSQ
jgi:aminoglycoside 9-adenylyltransferase